MWSIVQSRTVLVKKYRPILMFWKWNPFLNSNHSNCKKKIWRIYWAWRWNKSCNTLTWRAVSWGISVKRKQKGRIQFCRIRWNKTVGRKSILGWVEVATRIDIPFLALQVFFCKNHYNTLTCAGCSKVLQETRRRYTTHCIWLELKTQLIPINLQKNLKHCLNVFKSIVLLWSPSRGKQLYMNDNTGF